MTNKIFIATLLIVFFGSCKNEKNVIKPDYQQYLRDVKKSTYKIYNIVKEEVIITDKEGAKLFDATMYSKLGNQYYKQQLDVWVDGKQGIIDEEGNYVVPPEYKEVKFYQNGKYFAFKDTSWIYTNNNGKEFFNLPSNMSPKSIFGQNDLAAVEVGYRLYGFINIKGELVIDAKFKEVIEFGGYDITAVKNQDSKWGFINSEGGYVIPPQFKTFLGLKNRRFEDEIELVQSEENGYVLVNRITGEVVFENIYSQIPCPHSDLIPIIKNGNRAGFIDKKGSVVIPFEFQDVDCFDSRGLAPARIGTFWGWINKNGEYVIKPIFTQVWPFNDDDYAVVQSQKGTFGMVNREGDMVIPDTFLQIGIKKYAYKKDWELLLARSQKGWGYIDRSGKFVVEPRFLEQSANFHHRAYATVRDTSFYFGMIDRSGDYIFEPKFDFLRFYEDSDLLEYKLGDKTGYFSLDQKHYYGLSKESLEQLFQELLEERK